LPRALVVAAPAIATARNMLCVVGLRQVIFSNCISRTSRRRIGAEHRRIATTSTSRSVSCLPMTAIFASRGSSPERRLGDTPRSVHTAGDPVIYSLLQLLIVLVASAPSPSSLRIPFRAVRIFRAHDGAAIHRGIFLDARNARSGTGTAEWHRNECTSAFACPGENPRAAICDAANRSSPCRTIKDKENI
jgi:hypothetical protein